jgi:hypothetical protein
MKQDPKEMALHYQGHARHYSHWQARYREIDMPQAAIKMQRESAIAADTAMDYLLRLVDA